MTQQPRAHDAPNAATWLFAENFRPEADAAAPARRAAAELGCAPVLPGASALLTVLARAINAKAVVEVGTGAGVSGLALFRGMAPDGVLTSIDIEPEHQIAAREVFRDAGIAPQRFRLIAGRALDVLPNLRDGAYDLVLIDGDKLEYVEYFAAAMRLLRPGGMVVIDNALWHNRVADPTNEDDETVIIREALQAATDTEGLACALVPAGDGMLVGVRD